MVAKKHSSHTLWSTYSWMQRLSRRVLTISKIPFIIVKLFSFYNDQWAETSLPENMLQILAKKGSRKKSKIRQPCYLRILPEKVSYFFVNILIIWIIFSVSFEKGTSNTQMVTLSLAFLAWKKNLMNSVRRVIPQLVRGV